MESQWLIMNIKFEFYFRTTYFLLIFDLIILIFSNHKVTYLGVNEARNEILKRNMRIFCENFEFFRTNAELSQDPTKKD